VLLTQTTLQYSLSSQLVDAIEEDKTRSTEIASKISLTDTAFATNLEFFCRGELLTNHIYFVFITTF
jgi:hypothetical protein